MKRASAAKPRAPPKSKKAKYANAYKVAFEADFPWVGKSSRSTNHAVFHFVQSVLFHCVCPFRQLIMITECTLLLSSHYKKWLTVSVIHHLWSNEECTIAVMADWWLCLRLRLRISFAFCLERPKQRWMSEDPRAVQS